ncbi:hypothetical protein [Rhodopirellula halodulae]|uniref:hypothetical protein n=1 Tax=Rhodopirellula halodulae TaxID=2894198 RepID=UPI001E507BE1|nr:hypothetical protein [Rhodopirellula sp. JC737]MCC9655604.1 hypothetical protein [Rhodopirellula sp. JC737]
MPENTDVDAAIAEQIKNQLDQLVGYKIKGTLADSDGYDDLFGFVAEGPTGDLVECWLTNPSDCEIVPHQANE